MANVKITELDFASTPLAGSELIEIVQGGVNKKVEVNEVGGGVTEFIELTDVPASYTGQASKVVAVKADESGLEFVAGGGGATPTLQEVTNAGNTITDGTTIILKNGVINESILNSDSIVFDLTSDGLQMGYTGYGFGFSDTINGTLTLVQFETPTGIGTINIPDVGNGIETLALLSDITGGAVDSVNGQTGVVVLDSDDINEGATNLYFTDARALGAIPDATPTVKGIAKLYTSLGSNTDGAVDQNTVNSALALKANAPLIDTVSSSALTGVTTEGILKSYLIPANTLTASEILNFANDLYKTGTAGTVTSRLYTNTANSLSGASLLATNISTSGNRKVPLRRQLVLKGGNIEVISALGSLPDDNLNSSGVATIVTFNPAVDNYFITTAQNASAGDSTLQNNFKLHY